MVSPGDEEGGVAMTQRMSRERLVRRLAEAEGYLELEMPEKSLQILMGRPDWGTLQFEANLLTGEAYRIQGHYRDAIKPLEKAAALRPGDINAAVALGWCYKRTHCLAQAIDALERAERAHPDEPLLHYNLACYWCLAGGFDRSLTELNLALDLDPDLRERIAAEADFDRLRGHPEFDRLLLGRAPLV